MKRGQVTLFVVIGIVLLASVFIILALQRAAIDRQLDTQGKQLIQDFVEVNSLHYHVTSCLDKVATEGLTLIGEQGGVIYDDQGGLYPSNDAFGNPKPLGEEFLSYDVVNTFIDENGALTTETTNRRVAYGVTPMSQQDCVEYIPGVSSTYPDYTDDFKSYYPASHQYVNNLQNHYKNQVKCNIRDNTLPLYTRDWLRLSSFFGGLSLNRLCEKGGLNDYTNPDAVQLGVDTCSDNHFDDDKWEQSIQRQLREFIKNELPACVDISALSDIQGSEITVEGEPFVSVIFQSSQGIQVKADYNFSVSLQGKDPVVDLVSFQTNLDSKLWSLYPFIFDLAGLIANDYTNIDYTTLPTYLGSFTVEKKEGACVGCSGDSSLDDVYVVKDNRKQLKKDYYQFIFAAKQRKPVLDYLHNPLMTGTFGGHQLDFQVYVGDTITLEPQAYDLDGDDISYEYFGWREEYIDDFNLPGCLAEPGGCSPQLIPTYTTRTTDPPTHDWSTSAEFQATGRVATYRTTADDMGYHTVTVVARDEHGFEDYQNVKILVIDLPVARVEVENGYDDIKNEFASIEDPYLLDGSSSSASIMLGGVIDEFLFEDVLENFLIFQTPSSHTYDINDQDEIQGPAKYIIPDISKPTLAFSILNVVSGFFKKAMFTPPTPVEHEISLIVREDTGSNIFESPPDTKTVQVSECLPHGYVDDGDGVFDPLKDFGTGSGAIPYPYSTNDLDPSNYLDRTFDRPHVCCEPLDPALSAPNLEGGENALGSAVCFKKELYTGWAPISAPYVYFEKALQASENGELTSYPKTDANDYPGQGTPQQNDVWKLVYEQECSGSRGNVCAGDVNAVWSVYESCADFSFSEQFARCEGPGTGSRAFTTSIYRNGYSSSLSCKPFRTGYSFEKNVLRITPSNPQGNSHAQEISQGLCATPKSSDLSGYDTAGLYSCPGVCRSGSCSGIRVYDCECDAGNSCDAVPVSCFSPNPATSSKVWCQGTTACTGDCSIPDFRDNEAACTCKTSGVADCQSIGTTSWMDYDLASNGKCCVSGLQNIFIVNSQWLSGKPACLGGDIISSNSGKTISGKTVKVCNAQAFCCGSCPSSITNVVGAVPPGYNPIILPGKETSCGQQCCDATNADSDKESCACKVNGVTNGWASGLDFSNVPKFIDYNGFISVQGVTTKCCSGNGVYMYIASTGTEIPGKSVCHDGDLKVQGEMWEDSSGETRLLSCQGQIHYCCKLGNCNDNPPGKNYLGFKPSESSSCGDTCLGLGWNNGVNNAAAAAANNVGGCVEPYCDEEKDD